MFVPQAHFPDNYEIMSCLTRKVVPGRIYNYDKTAEETKRIAFNVIHCLIS